MGRLQLGDELPCPSVSGSANNRLPCWQSVRDFAKGVDPAALPEPVRLGLENHRFVDRFTDHHPDVAELKALFSPQRRRFAGIMLDMVFDHLLIKHWERFSSDVFAKARAGYYADLHQGQDLMPPAMQRTTTRIVSQDWFSSYAELEGVGFALDRIAQRIRFQNPFQGSVTELQQHFTAIKQASCASFLSWWLRSKRRGLSLLKCGYSQTVR